MAHRVARKQAARAARLRAEAQAHRQERRQKLMRHAGAVIVAVIAVVLVAFAIGRGGSGAVSSKAGASTNGPALGAVAPSFTLTDVVSGQQLSLASLRGHETLMFFSEGVGCQPCMVQAADLQNSPLLQKAGIRLVSITTDEPSALAAGAKQYAITTPLLSDPSTSMSRAYGMLSHGGMQMPGADGHAFMLLDPKGKILWHQAYQSMYVAPDQLIADMTSGSAGTAGMAMSS